MIGWYDAALVWDRLNQRGWLSGTPNAVAELSKHLTGTNVESDYASIQRDAHRSPGGPTQFESNMARSEYLERIEAARRYIEAGDIYQVNSRNAFPPPWRFRDSKPI